MQRARDSKPGTDETPGTAALYIASLAEELAALARGNGLDALGYILDMAQLEAQQVSKQSRQASVCPRLLPPPTAN
jgi:hypothetical protein